jgi:hypothetical protein
MIWACQQLLTPMRYLRIRQGISLFKSKAVYDWVLPMLISIPATYIGYKYSIGIFSEKGVIGGFQKLLEILVPFYIAALAAVATFARDGLDEPLKGHAATVSIRHSNGMWVEHVLTRRQFICYLFGYLAFLSLVLFVGILFLNLVSQKSGLLAHELFGEQLQYAKIAAIYIFMVPIWQMIVITLLGVYFMSERLMVMTEEDQ